MLTPRSTSVALTDGIRVTVQSKYLAEQSVPRMGRYVWAYTIRIENEGAPVSYTHLTLPTKRIV